MIEISNLKIFPNGSPLARFNVKVTEWKSLVIKECCLFEVNGRRWITFPSRKYEVEGKTKYLELVGYEDRTMNDRLKEAILQSVLLMINKPSEKSDDIPF